MTPIVKLVFGIDYDKARLTEFAAASVLCASGRTIAAGRLPGFHREAAGRPQGAGRGRAPGAPARAKRRSPRRRGPRHASLRPRRSRSPICRGRRNSRSSSLAAAPTARHEPVAVLDDEALVERAIRKAA